MVTGIRWRTRPPSNTQDVWHFIHRSDLGAVADAVVTIDATNDDCKTVTANDAARSYLDKTDDGSALTFIMSRYTDARQAPVTLTLDRREWRLSDLENQADEAFQSALRSETPDGLDDLLNQTQDMRRQLDELHAALLT